MSFDLYKARFERELRLAIDKMGERSLLRDACSYALTNGGKRLRPFLVLMIGDALGTSDVMPSALSVEFFHTASLIADDLPSMDNDSIRRGVPSLHVLFGESTALLASYTLIAEGYGGIYENGKILRNNPLFAASADRRAMECLEAATRCAGIQGATQGQFLDLFPPDLSIRTILDMIYKKTVTLFEISFLFGWIFGGGDLQKIPLLKACASHLGLAFQIADDLEDMIQDAAIGKGVNMVSALGKEKAISYFEEEIASLERTMKALHLWTEPFQDLVARLVSKPALLRSELS